MCDFHSVIVTGDGKILHLAENSHSRIAAHYELGAGLDAKWWECEWDGVGDMPLPADLVQTRGKNTEPTQAAVRAAEIHYTKLAAVMAGQTAPEDLFPFNEPEYSDVRYAVDKHKEELRRQAEAAEAKRVAAEREAAADAEAQTAFESVDDLLSVLDNDILIRVIHKLAGENNIEIEEIAADEIQAVKDAAEEWDSDHPAYQAGLESGYESASEDMYTADYISDSRISDWFSDEQIADAAEDLIDEARTEGYAEGYRDCRQGRPSAQPEYFIDGMPSFLC